MSQLPRLLLFDYGGVLLNLNDPLETFGFGESHADFSRRWLLSGAVRAHETGRIGPMEFGRRMVRDMQLPYSAEEFVRRFDSWPDRVAPETAALVAAIPAAIDCAILSNTNALHWQAQNIRRDFGGRISHCFLSFETGHIKPDSEAFRQVIDALDYEPDTILFIDDNPRNLDAAVAEGMRTRHCPDVHALGAVLRAEGILN